MSKFGLVLTLLLTAGAALGQKLETTAGVTRTVLENGLTVLTKEVKSAPVVSVQVFYKIGSRNEAPGVNGIAHQLEHMLFKGTKKRPVQFGRLFGALGSQSNAFTYYDQTAYYGTVEKEKAGALLALEADRMANAQIDPDKLASERKVVLSEIEGNENDPAFRLEKAVQSAAFPQSPYGLTVGGTRADIEGFSADKVGAYYKKYYSPEYATLIVVGDFDTKTMLRQIKTLYRKLGVAGTKPIVTSEPLNGVTDESTLKYMPSKTPIVLKEPGSTPLINAVYPLPNINGADVPALKVLDSVLLSGRNSRLYQALFETGLAADGGTFPYHFLNGGWYNFSFTPAPDKNTAEVDAALLGALEVIRSTPPSADEVTRSKTQIVSSTLLGSRSITAQATALGTNATSANDYQYTDKFLAALEKVTPEDVQRVAKLYLDPARRTVGYFEPTVVVEGSGNAPVGGAPQQGSYSAGPAVDPGEVAKYLPKYAPSGQAQVKLPESVKLPNGMQIFLLRDPSTPTISLSANVLAGREFDTDAKAGLVDQVAGNLFSGTKTRDALTLSGLLENVGASLSPAANRFGVAFDGSSLSKDLPVLLEVLSDVLQNATFPQDQFVLTQSRALQGAKRAEDDPGQQAIRLFRKTLYPVGNPWQVFSTQTTLKSLTRADLETFYKAQYRPDTTILTLVGDFDPVETKKLVENKFGAWKAEGPTPRISYPIIGKPSGVVKKAVVIPNKTQSVTYLGYQSISRSDPRYFDSLVLNQILGGDTLSSRLGGEIRDKLGLTYGINSSFAALKQPGAFSISLQTNPQDTARAVDATLTLVGDVKDKGLSEAEVNTAKLGLVSSYTVALADPVALAGTFTDLASNGLPLTELTDYQAKINAVTLESVNKAAKELLDPENIVVVTAGP